MTSTITVLFIQDSYTDSSKKRTVPAQRERNEEKIIEPIL
jgi:hypothetical protein